MHKICDLDAEKCVLSIMITDPTKREFAFEKLRREDFFSVWHRYFQYNFRIVKKQ